MTTLLKFFLTLRERKEKAFIPYLVAGYPNLSSTPLLLQAAAKAGASAIELGIPFSDPVADGPILQKAGFESLKKGTTLERVLDMVASVSKEIRIPILLMGYANPFLRFGWKKLAEKSKKAGVSGFIIADLPMEEAHAVKKIFESNDLGLCPLCAPTTQADRIRRIGEICTGFVYLVAVKGVTGSRDALSSDLIPFVKRARLKTDKPLMVGFGVSTPEQAQTVIQEADGVVLGSRIAVFLEEHKDDTALPKHLEEFLLTWTKALRCYV